MFKNTKIATTVRFVAKNTTVLDGAFRLLRAYVFLKFCIKFCYHGFISLVASPVFQITFISARYDRSWSVACGMPLLLQAEIP